ncbi:Two-component response regulator CreC, partial [Enterobacter kobei]|nr:Two-component response regulator CreC [Enterobacter kobei]
NILEQNARMQALVEKLLHQAKLENRLEITPEPVLLAPLFATLAELHASTLLQKAVRLTLDPAPGSLRVAGDEALLH